MTDPFEAAQQRRQPLVPSNNPRTGLDYVIVHEGVLELNAFAAPVRLRLRYIPDGDIASADVFGAYCDGLGGFAWNSLEDFGQTVLGDINSELVPRWAQIQVTIDANGQMHQVLLEERRPNWDNPKLLARL